VRLEPFGSIPEAGAALDAATRSGFEAALARCDEAHAVERLWSGDFTLWRPDPAEIANRLGWLRAPVQVRPGIGRIERFVAAVREEGVTDVLVLGMGGSSLAPDLFGRTFPTPGFPRVAVLDSTDPAAVRDAERSVDPARTLFVVSTKSGGTVETLSFFKYFHGLVAERLGAEAAGRRFVAITDPGSSLERTARAIGAREVFLADPEVGGRFSALTLFGLVPAALAGVSLPRLLDRAEAMAARCGLYHAFANPGASLGALVAAAALAGRDKLTIVASDPVRSFGAWAEQLLAESTGKDRRGIVPVDNEPVGPAGCYGDDRLFVFLTLAGEQAHEGEIENLAAAGHPVLRIELADPYDLGGEFFRWETATAVAGFLLGVHPFDQPDVEAAKVRAREALAAYLERGSLPAEAPVLAERGITLFGDAAGPDLAAALRAFARQAGPGHYLGLQAYLPPRPGIAQALDALQCVFRVDGHHAVTIGFGPRFLHSTGQLHKGGPPTGHFIQLTADPAEEVTIPDDFGGRAGRVGFGVLERAQALGDAAALRAAGRPVARLHLGADPAAGLATLSQIIGQP